MSDYPRLKSFNLSDQDFQNLKRVAAQYDVSDSAVIRLGLHRVFEENGLPVNGEAEWHVEPNASALPLYPGDREAIAKQVAALLVDELKNYEKERR